MELWKPVFKFFTNFFVGIDMEKIRKKQNIFGKEKRVLKKYGEY